MKKGICVLGLLLVFVFSSFSSGDQETPAQPQDSPNEQASMELKFAYGGPNLGPFAQTNQWFCDEIAKRTNGKIKITIHWGGTLVSQPDTLSAVGKGVADIGSAMGGPTVSQNPHWSTLSMGSAGKDPWALMWATYEMLHNNENIISEMEKHNVMPTHGYFPGTPILVLKKAVTSLSDLKGLRIRAATPDEAMAWSKLGVETVMVTMPETYDSIDKGVIDGTLVTVAWADSLKLGDVAKYWYRFPDNLIGGDVTTCINKDVWNDFTSETQSIIEELIREYNDKYAKAVFDLEEKVIEQVQSLGVQYQDMTEEVDNAYTEAMKIAHQAWFDKWDGKGNNTNSVWEDYQRYVAITDRLGLRRK